MVPADIPSAPSDVTKPVFFRQNNVPAIPLLALTEEYGLHCREFAPSMDDSAVGVGEKGVMLGISSHVKMGTVLQRLYFHVLVGLGKLQMKDVPGRYGKSMLKIEPATWYIRNLPKPTNMMQRVPNPSTDLPVITPARLRTLLEWIQYYRAVRGVASDEFLSDRNYLDM